MAYDIWAGNTTFLPARTTSKLVVQTTRLNIDPVVESVIPKLDNLITMIRRLNSTKPELLLALNTLEDCHDKIITAIQSPTVEAPKSGLSFG